VTVVTLKILYPFKYPSPEMFYSPPSMVNMASEVELSILYSPLEIILIKANIPLGAALFKFSGKNSILSISYFSATFSHFLLCFARSEISAS